MYILYKKKIGQELIVAFLMSAAWVAGSGFYNYRDASYMFHTFNLFTLFAWTAGLVILRELYEHFNSKQYKWLKVSGMYVIVLLLIEVVGYHILKIQLDSGYMGLFGFDVLHVPWWGQIYYLTAGPIYLLITDYLNVK